MPRRLRHIALRCLSTVGLALALGAAAPLDESKLVLTIAPLAVLAAFGFPTLRRTLEQWFERQRIRPNVIGEFDDSTLIEVFGQAGKGIFATPSIVESSVRRQYGVAIVGRLDRVRERSDDGAGSLIAADSFTAGSPVLSRASARRRRMRCSASSRRSG